MIGGFLSVLLLAGMISLSWYYLLDEADEEFGEFDEYTIEWTDQNLRGAMLRVESYHRIFGFYPESLELALGSEEIYDPLPEECECGDSSDFFYQVLDEGSSYSLFSKGPDCQPFTEDDRHLEISDAERPGLGITPGFIEIAAADTGSCDDT